MSLSETVVDEAFILRMDEFRRFPEGGKLVEECSKSVVLFSEKMLGIKLYSWQVDFLSRIQASVDGDQKREFIALTSRQIGKSTAIAIFALWVCVFNKYTGSKKNVKNNTVIGVVSASDVQAKKLLHDIELFIRQGDRFMRDSYLNERGASIFGEKYFSVLIDNQQANNTTTITFKGGEKSQGLLLKDSKSGSVIKSYPPTSVVLGETFSIVIVDEAGKSDRIDDVFFDDYIYPTGNALNAIRIYTSTPWVPSGFFYRMADPNDEFTEHNASRVMYTIDAIKIENPEYYASVKKAIDIMVKDGKTDEVKRAYYCRFVKGEISYFNPDKVRPIFTDSYQMLESYGSECDMGIDYGGQVTSRTVITISAMDSDNHIRRIYHRAYEVGKDLTLINDVADLLTRFNVQRIVPDDCPAGDFLNRIMLEKGWNVQPMNFRTDKVKKYGAFRSSVNKGLVESYKDSPLEVEMMSLEQNEGNRQSYIMHAVGYTDDLIDSFVMSCYFFVEDEEDLFKFHDLPEESVYSTGDSYYEERF
jgi:hypothetical protein